MRIRVGEGAHFMQFCWTLHSPSHNGCEWFGEGLAAAEDRDGLKVRDELTGDYQQRDMMRYRLKGRERARERDLEVL